MGRERSSSAGLHSRHPWFLVLAFVGGFAIALFPSWALAAQEWVRYQSAPVFPVGAPGSWDDYGFYGSSPAVVAVGDALEMYYIAISGPDFPEANMGRIGMARSTDGGVTWTRCASNPIDLGFTAPFNESYTPAVVADGNVRQLWFSHNEAFGGTVHIDDATSEDGCSSWSPHRTVLEPTPDAWDSWRVHVAGVVHDGVGYHMWYVGMPCCFPPQSAYGLGYATSPDGVTWTKYAGNPIMTDIEAAPTVQKVGDLFHLWARSEGCIRHWTSSDGLAWNKAGDLELSSM